MVWFTVLPLSLALLPRVAVAQQVEIVAADARPSVAVILSKSAEGLVSGTGFAVSDHLVVTAYHVVRSASEIVLKFPNLPVVPARVFRADPDTDIAVLEIPSLPLHPLTLGNLSRAQEGDTVVVIGYPRIDVLGAQTATVTEGIISAIRPGLLQIQAPISPGNSGGPVVNIRGEVLGIVEGTLKGEQQGINFAVPIAFVERLLGAAIHAPLPSPSMPRPSLPSAPSPPAVGSGCYVPHFTYHHGIVVFNEHGIATQFHVDIADTVETQRYGLMCRSSLEANAGMLFVFPADTQGSFWMKNVYLPLTIVFFDNSWRIISVMDMNVASDPRTGPFARYSPSQPYRYALVINQGILEQRRIDSNALVGFVPLAP